MGASRVDLNSQDSVVPASEPRESSRRASPPPPPPPLPRQAASSEYCEEEEDERNSWPPVAGRNKPPLPSSASSADDVFRRVAAAGPLWAVAVGGLSSSPRPCGGLFLPLGFFFLHRNKNAIQLTLHNGICTVHLFRTSLM